MFGIYRHEWHQVSSKSYNEDRPHGTFVRTIYYHIEECCKCGKQRKAIYNAWIHKLEPENTIERRADHSCMMWIAYREYESVEAKEI